MGRRDRGGFDEPSGRRGRREEGPGRDRFEGRGGQPEDRDARLAEFRQRIDDRLDRFEERLDRFEERLERLAQGR